MADKSNGIEFSDWARGPPANVPFATRLGTFFYNKKEGSILGRTPKRWGILLLFYACFYTVLVALFYVCMMGLFQQIDSTVPHYTLKESLIGVNPGVAYRPRDDVKEEFKFNSANTSWIQTHLQDFLSDYNKESWYADLKECYKGDSYGLQDNKPCFYIKLNRIFDWIPEFYDGEKIPFPEDMPVDLRSHIQGLEASQRQKIWVSCSEEGGNSTKPTEITYPWGRGAFARSFPYRNQPGHVPAILAVRLTPPANELVKIRCRMWAKNIIYNGSIREPRGYARILLKMEDALTTA